jgi:hypothetical protein
MHLLLSFAGFCSVLPVVAISYIPAVVHQPQIASSIVQAITIYMVTFFALSKLPAQNAFYDHSMQCDVPGTFVASSIKRIVAYGTMSWNRVPGSSG